MFARALGRALGRRAWLLVLSPFVRIDLGVITDILVKGKRVIPARVSALGYRFRFPALDGALQDLLGGEPDDDAGARHVLAARSVRAGRHVAEGEGLG